MITAVSSENGSIQYSVGMWNILSTLRRAASLQSSLSPQTNKDNEENTHFDVLKSQKKMRMDEF